MRGRKIIFIVILLVAGFAGGVFYSAFDYSPVPAIKELVNRELGKPADVDFNDFWNVWGLLHEKYVDKDKLDTQELVYGAIDGLVKAVDDPYTTFLKPKESQELAEQISGSFSGVGIEIGIRKNTLTVIAPIKDTPAAKAGLLAGDKILQIDDKSTEGIKLDEAVKLIRGPRGSKVVLTIGRGEPIETKEIPITRDKIKIPTAEWSMIGDNIAHIEIFVFNRNLDQDFERMAKEILDSGVKKIILDLRNNPGGLLDSAVNISGYFLDAGQVVTVEKFGNGQENVFRSQNSGQLKNFPLAVLINKGSASASEILAGALRDNKGAVIVGETSFGKGSVQEIIDLPRKSSLKVTVAKWFTPKGVSITDNGIKPDYEIERTEEDINNDRDSQLDKALELIKNL